jgi:hypothetical protein
MSNPMIFNSRRSFLQVFKVQQTPIGWEVNNADFDLLFDPQTQIDVQRLTFKSSNISIQNLNLLGSLAFDNCNVTIVNSQISPNPNLEDFVILADNKSTLIADKVKVNSNKINSIIVKNQSISSFTQCQISNYLTGITIDNESKTFFLNCQLKNENEIDNSQFIKISQKSTFQVIESTFQKCSANAIVATSGSFLDISKCSFSEFKQRLMDCSTDSKALIHHSHSLIPIHHLIFFVSIKANVHVMIALLTEFLVIQFI